ncbi:MAG: protein-L-isoaspartate O-methyltransferase [Neisseriaceae bacterium]|nr:protein-L-isoaspartate O-methyltransferase [Neisseriaceae bacterium]
MSINLTKTNVAHFNMVEQQIRPWNVYDNNILDALSYVDRVQFVPEQYATLAFADVDLPLGNGTTLLTPKVTARLIQSLKLQATDNVLEIGCGLGYSAALMAHLCREVSSVDVDENLVNLATKNLAQAELFNVTVKVGDGYTQATGKKFNAILIQASFPSPPIALFEGLSAGGRLVCVIGQAPSMVAMCYTKMADGSIADQPIFDTNTPCLATQIKAPQFTF